LLVPCTEILESMQQHKIFPKWDWLTWIFKSVEMFSTNLHKANPWKFFQVAHYAFSPFSTDWYPQQIAEVYDREQRSLILPLISWQISRNSSQWIQYFYKHTSRRVVSGIASFLTCYCYLFILWAWLLHMWSLWKYQCNARTWMVSWIVVLKQRLESEYY